MIAALEATADEINKKGTYKVNLLKFKSSEGLTLTMNIAPVLKDSSLKSVVVDVYIPNDFEKNLTASLNGLFHSKSDTVINGRIALTNIVNNLIANVEPAEADIDVITKIIEDLLGELEE